MKIRIEENLINDEEFLKNCINFLLESTQIRFFRCDKGYGLNDYDFDFLMNYKEDLESGVKISDKRKWIVIAIVMKYYSQILYFARNKGVYHELQRNTVV